MAKKLIKPLSLGDIQMRYNRPVDITRMSTEQMYTYYTHIARTANSRLASLERAAEKPGNEYLNLYKPKEFIERMASERRGGEANITLANRLRIPEPGQRNRTQLLRMIKTTEEFLSLKTSTVTGARERYADQMSFMNQFYDLDMTPAEAAALVEAGTRGGVSTDGWYEMLKIVADPSSAGLNEDNPRDVVEYIDRNFAFVDEEIASTVEQILKRRAAEKQNDEEDIDK